MILSEYIKVTVWTLHWYSETQLKKTENSEDGSRSHPKFCSCET